MSLEGDHKVNSSSCCWIIIFDIKYDTIHGGITPHQLRRSGWLIALNLLKSADQTLPEKSQKRTYEVMILYTQLHANDFCARILRIRQELADSTIH